MPEGEGEELDTDDTEEEATDDGRGEGTSSTVEEVKPEVVGGRLSGTEVGWTAGPETVGEGTPTELELEDPPVMVNVGEMLPEFPITVFDISLAG